MAETTVLHETRYTGIFVIGIGIASLLTRTYCKLKVRLCIKILPYADASTKSSHWIEEIAHCPDAEITNRAGASFLDWGAVDGCAADEVDARAMGSSGLVLSNVAQKLRFVYWIIRIAAGNARAWRLKGLADRPRAEYARLEPASSAARSICSYRQKDECVSKCHG